MYRTHLLITLITLVVVADHATADSLFESDEILAVTLQGPLNQLNRERDKEQRYSGTLRYNDEGQSKELAVELQVRGNRRLSNQTCAFAPLRVIVDKDSVKKTLFHKQKKLKLVVQCRAETKMYEQYLITEYLIYRALNLLTENSYRVRLLDIAYAHESGSPSHQDYGFFIESNRRMAKRIERDRWRVEKTNATFLDKQHLNLISLFQFMIGNTDWSATHGGNDECCHNGKLFGEPDGNANLYIPYDFDMTGLVDPEYGATPPELKLDSLRERRYRGYCRNNDFLDQNIALFNEREAEIIALFEESPLLSKPMKRKRVAYIKKFYRIINDPARVERMIHGWCHQSQMVETSS